MGISICRIANGRIVEEWTTWDALGFLQQIGVIPELIGKSKEKPYGQPIRSRRSHDMTKADLVEELARVVELWRLTSRQPRSSAKSNRMFGGGPLETGQQNE